MKLFLGFLSFFVFAPGVHADIAIKKETILYKQGDTTLEGYLAKPMSRAGKRPGILVVHDWTGVGPFTKGRTEQLAQLGYVALAADIYGQGVRPTDPKEAGAISSKYKKDRALMRQRIEAALIELRKQKGVDPERIAVIGYCFGGTVALELARAGANVKGVVTFHGGLDTPTPQDAKNIKGKVLALQGADDPFVNADQVKAFEEEMRSGGVDWQLIKYSKSVHAFTNPDAGSDNAKGVAYNAEADHRSWQAMKDFFNEIFPK